LSWIGSKWEACGPRCTFFYVYQQKDAEQVPRDVFFLCNNTISAIEGGQNDFENLKDEDKSHLYSNDEFARIAAGAIAWTGYDLNNWTDRQTRSYLRSSKWSPYPTVSKTQVETLLARYSIGAIAAFGTQPQGTNSMYLDFKTSLVSCLAFPQTFRKQADFVTQSLDDHGLRYEVANQKTRPVQGQQLQVDWIWVLSLLGAICLIQFVALVLLVSFANKSIIRDESAFSLAMLLSPVVNRIGKEGMNLSGDEIKNHAKLRWKKIRYDYREGANGEPNQVDIFFQGKDTFDSRRSWTPGIYM